MFPRVAPVFATVLLALSTGSRAAKVDFTREILPVISSKCFHCHGPDEQTRDGGRRLDIREEALKEIDGIRALVPGDLAASDLIVRITSTDKDEVMPPPKENHALTSGEVELIKAWVQQGAEYKPHWSFAKLQRPEIPASPASGIPRASHAIDAFIRTRLAVEGLAPSPPADPHTLCRRVHLDLTGLPPAPAEMAEFVESYRRDGPQVSYERLVDRLLASPAYGERWAKMWLDLARYADSTGYGSDKFRLNIWPWRDWVINAFNRNLPYDQFTIEQLAGDLLPNARPEQIAATAFHRNTMTNVEGGTDDEEYRVAAIKDRVATTGQVWMGLTVGCAQCHSHKFDPISHREYYGLFAVFNQTEDSDRDDEEPKIPIPTRQEQQQRERLQAELATLQAQLNAETPDIEAAQHAWEAEQTQSGTAALPEVVRAALALEPTEREPEQRAAVAAHFRSVAPRFAEVRKQIEAKKGEIGKVKPVALPIMRELGAEKRRKTHVFNKGNFLQKGDEVEATLLAAFPAPAAMPPRIDRLELAKWLVGRNNPLTARVAVNRFWSQLFGTGLVETEEDFGTQGAQPSHPELLDWLALEFMENGWDMKRLLKLVVTSATYQQSSKTTAEHLQKDARNRLLARFPRGRLDAEGVRDQALMLSGLLSGKIGGPSVYPPQPDGLWRVAFNGGQNAYPTSTGEDRYRRGLYTFWRRTMPNPTMSTFDAPSRETCTVRRAPTNTPLQAFVTLNDPVFVECAQGLARRILREGGATTAERLRFALGLCLARPADEAQLAALQALFDAELATQRAAPEAAKKLATGPTQPLPEKSDAAEVAAWTVVANVLLNLDAVLTKG